jgi:hypothetical protein
MSRNAIQRFLHDYEWLHISVGVIGNATFFVGSIFFLPVYSDWMAVGVWLFITGSFLMLLGALAGGLKRHWEHSYGPPDGRG